MSKAKAYELAEKLGVSIEIDYGSCITIESPEFHQLSGADGHCRVYDIADGITNFFTKKSAWSYVIEDLREGIEPCRVKNCDYCSEARG